MTPQADGVATHHNAAAPDPAGHDALLRDLVADPLGAGARLPTGRVLAIVDQLYAADPASLTNSQRAHRDEAALALMWTPHAAEVLVRIESLKAFDPECERGDVFDLLRALRLFELGDVNAAEVLLEGLSVAGAGQRAADLAAVLGRLIDAAHLNLGKIADTGRVAALAIAMADDLYQIAPPWLAADILVAQLSLARCGAAVSLPRITPERFRHSRPGGLANAVAAIVHRDADDARALAGMARGLQARVNIQLVMAREFKRRWRLPAALGALDAALELRPASAMVLTQRAEVLHLLGDRAGALASAHAARSADPLQYEAAEIIFAIDPKQLDVDVMRLTACVGKAPNKAYAAMQAVKILLRLDLWEDADQLLTYALGVLGPEDARRDGLVYLSGYCAELRHNLPVALASYRTPTPEGSLFGYRKAMGAVRCLTAAGRFDEADKELRNVDEAPVRPFGYAAFDAARLDLRLSQDRVGEAYSAYRLRNLTNELRVLFGDKYLAAERSLEDIPRDARILVLNESGPGDEIRMASLYDDLCRRFDHLTVTCEPRLRPMMSRNFPVIRFLPVARSRPEFRQSSYYSSDRVMSRNLADMVDNSVIEAAHGADVVVSIYDLLAMLRTDRHAFPRDGAYLDAAPKTISRWRSHIEMRSGRNDVLRVGLNWRSLLLDPKRNQHYLDAQDLAPLAGLKNVEVWPIQPGMTLEELEILFAHLPRVMLPHALDLRDDFEGMAAFLSCMDLVVAPCTTNAELAGALGRPTLLMAAMPATAWRRNPDGSDIWHATARVITGDTIGHRESLVRNVLAFLEAEARTNSAQDAPLSVPAHIRPRGAPLH